MYSEFFNRDLTDQEVQDLIEFTAGAKPGYSKEFFGVVMQCRKASVFQPCSCCIFSFDTLICMKAVDCTRGFSNVIFTVKQ